MEERIVIAGFGGQGVMAIGQLLTYAGMIEDKMCPGYPLMDQKCVGYSKL